MSDRAPLPDPMLREQRERTIASLCDHFAHDRLTMEELERRIDLAERSRAPAELAVLLQDLAPAPATAPAPAPYRPPLPAAERPPNTVIVAVMGGVDRSGAWQPAARNFVLGLMGGVELDFRDVPLPAGETEVFVLALMGGVDIIVPPDMIVDASGVAIMGGFGHVHQARGAPADAPILRVRGLALMGGVDIMVRLPGESAGDAKRRLREEARARKRLRGG